MTAPIGGHVGVGLETVRDAVVDLLLVGIRLGIALADTLGDDAGVALGVAGILAVLALHASRVLEEVAAEGAPHDVVELMLDKLVAIHLVDLFLALADRALPIQAEIDRASFLLLLHKAESEANLTGGFQVEPAVNGLDDDLGYGLGSGRVRTGLAAHGSWRCGGRSKRRRLLRTRGELTWRRAHSVGGDPAGAVDLGFNPLPSHLLGNVGYSDPQHGNGNGVFARPVIDSKLDLVCLVDVDMELLSIPAVVARGSRACNDIVLDLDGDVGFGTAAEAAGRSVVDILDAGNTDGQLASERLAQVGHIDRVIC